MFTIDKNAPIPLYHQIKELLKRQIEEGVYKPNDRLLTESELAARFRVSKITVRQALRELAEMGYVRREQGRGTFVAEPRLDQGPRELTSFTEEMRKRGYTPGSTVLEAALREASEEVAFKLALAAGATVFMLRRLRLADNEPMGLQTAWLPADLLPGIERVCFENVSLYEVLQKTYGLYAVSARETHFATVADADLGRVLGIPPGAPVMACERVSFLPGGRPLEYVSSIMRGDRYRIVLELTRYVPA